MIIHKSHSKADLIDLINNLNLKVVFSHQDNKKDIQDKIVASLYKPCKINDNFYNIQNKDGLIKYLTSQNSKKTLTIKQKNAVMMITKHIIQYCKNNYNLEYSKYDHPKDLQDDLDYVKQFGDIPSVRRACKLMNNDPKFTCYNFIPYISPQVQKVLDEKKAIKKTNYNILTIRRSTPDNPVLVYFD